MGQLFSFLDALGGAHLLCGWLLAAPWRGCQPTIQLSRSLPRSPQYKDGMVKTSVQESSMGPTSLGTVLGQVTSLAYLIGALLMTSKSPLGSESLEDD